LFDLKLKRRMMGRYAVSGRGVGDGVARVGGAWIGPRSTISVLLFHVDTIHVETRSDLLDVRRMLEPIGAVHKLFKRF
jgi:hypothetical protein